VAIPHPGKEGSPDIIYPFIGINLCTGQTKTTLATKRNLLYLATFKTPIRDESILWVTAGEHLFNHTIMILRPVFWTHLLKLFPVVYKEPLKYILVPVVIQY